ncbi:MAG: GNAT family N-acetyltransferase [Nitrospiraceae bacterium]
MIRQYRESDVETLALLFTDSVHNLASSHYDANQRAAWAPRPPELNGWMARLACLRTLVAETDMKIAGFVSYEQSGHIDLLYTSPAYSRRGVALALYFEAEANLASNGISKLFTEASLVARPFFERCGFHVVEEQYLQIRGVTIRRQVMQKSLAVQQTLARA